MTARPSSVLSRRRAVASGFAFAGGSITHDGHLIDKTHVHTDAGGVGLSGPPP